MQRFVVAVMAVATLGVTALAQNTEPVDTATLARIRDEGLNRSQVMEHLFWLTDAYGPRLTGSPGFEQAGDWVIETLRAWGIENPRKERFEFGEGWSLRRFHATMLEPQVMPIIAVPKAWSSDIDGTVTAEVVRPDIATAEDAERYRGQLGGKIVLTQPAREVRLLEQERIVLRMTDAEIEEARSLPPPRGGGARAGRAGGGRGGGGARGRGGRAGGAERFDVNAFYQEEGVLALFDRGSNADTAAGGSNLSWRTQRTDGGTFGVGSGGSRDAATAGTGLPQVTLAVEHYNRMVRLLDHGVPVRVELTLDTEFHPEARPNGFNILAELPGTDLADEIVLIGGHFDSWHGATGATDNATGSAAMLEVLRIFKELGLRPRRTIRLALWGAEEQGLIGSRLYAQQYLGTPEAPGPEQARHSVYFNLDNGTGRIRGIWMEENEAVEPVFRAWIAPLRDLGVEILGPRSVGSTDHASIDRAGVPAFQFIQERLEYNSRTHHTNMDVYDRVQADDLKQIATVVASFVWQAANRDERLPRKPAGGRP